MEDTHTHTHTRIHEQEREIASLTNTEAAFHLPKLQKEDK